MVVIEQKKLLLRDRLVFFPSREELERLTELSPMEIVRVSQSREHLPSYSTPVSEKVFLTTCIDLTREIDAIHHDMDDKSCRYEIRRATKLAHRLAITRNDAQSCEHFFALYNQFVSWKGHTKPLSRARFQAFCEVSDVWLITIDGIPACGHLVLRDGSVGRARLIFSASARFQDSEVSRCSGALNRYLHWNEIQAYKSEDMHWYDFGGLQTGASPIDKFKLSFGGGILEEQSYVLAGALGRMALNGYSYFQRVFRPGPVTGDS